MTRPFGYRAFHAPAPVAPPGVAGKALVLQADTPCLVWSYGDSAEMGPQDAYEAIELGKDEHGNVKMVRGDSTFTWPMTTVGGAAACRTRMNTRLVVLVRGRVDEEGRQRWVEAALESLGEELERLRAVVAQYEIEQAPSSAPLIDQNKLTAAWSAAERST